MTGRARVNRVWFSGTKAATADGRKLVDMPAGWYEPVKTEIDGRGFVTTYKLAAR